VNRYAWFAGLVLAADQLSKYWVTHVIKLWRGPRDLAPFLSLTWVENRGISMGLLDLGDSGRWVLVALTAAIALIVAWWLAREENAADSLALASILGGAVGNIIDRVRLGFVVDFVHLHVGARSFYVFNVADAAITLGVAALLARGLIKREQPTRSHAE
jgi:signal peptidase II